MSDSRFPLPDPERSRLRTIVATVGHEISLLPTQATTDDRRNPPNGLLASWTDLVKQLALGPEPEVRECPVCKHIGMRAATRCGHCWTKLSPLTDP